MTSPVTNGPRRPSTLTNAAGEFSIRVMTSATPFALPIYASKHGYAGGMLEARKWQPGETRNDIVITLVRGFTIAVRVRDRQHQPVEHAYVNLTRTGDGAQQGFFSPAECDDPTRQDCRRTGADGSVVFRTSEGPHSVFVTGDEVAPKRVPSVTLTARSEPVVVEVDRGVTITGRVVHSDGTPVAGAIIEMPRSQLAPRNATTDSDGTFTLAGIASGATTLTALSSDRHMTSAPVPVTAPAKNVTITMPHGARIEGRVVDRGTKQPVTDFTVSLPSRGRPTPPPQQVHADDGTYAIDNVAPGTAQIAVTATGYVTATRSDITAEEGKTVSGIDVQLDRGASITGRVTSGGAPVAGVQVSLTANRMPFLGGGGRRPTRMGTTPSTALPKGSARSSFRERDSSSCTRRSRSRRGRICVSTWSSTMVPRFEAASPTAPVTTFLALTLRSPATAWRPATWCRRISMAASSCRASATGSYHLTARKEGYVSEDVNDVIVPQSQPLTFALDHGATITGRVTGLSPEELAQVVVAASGGTSRNQTPVDSAGNFTLHGMPDGRIRVDAFLSAAGRNRTAIPKTIVVENGAAPPVELDFSEGITISGHVTHAGVAFRRAHQFLPDAANGAEDCGRTNGTGQWRRNDLVGRQLRRHVAGAGRLQRTHQRTEHRTRRPTPPAAADFDVDIRGAMLRGHVVDAATGAPLANAQVIVFSRAVQANGSAMTDSEGHFAIDALADAVYDLRATREPYSVATQQVTVSGGTAPEVEVRHGASAVRDVSCHRLRHGSTRRRFDHGRYRAAHESSPGATRGKWRPQNLAEARQLRGHGFRPLLRLEGRQLHHACGRRPDHARAWRTTDHRSEECAAGSPRDRRPSSRSRSPGDQRTLSADSARVVHFVRARQQRCVVSTVPVLITAGETTTIRLP